MPKPQRKKSPPKPTALEPVERFAEALQKILGRLPRTAEEVQELLGRWDQLGDGTPGLLGGNLLAVLNEAVLDEQTADLSQAVAGRKRSPGELADHADFVADLFSEYAALIKVLVHVELTGQNSLARDWERVADELLQRAAEIQTLSEEMEVEVEEAEETETAGAVQGEFRTVSPALLRDLWRQSLAGKPLEGEPARLAAILSDHPEYRAAWESGKESTIDGINPFVHATMHVAVERQIAHDDPEEVRTALERMTAAGVARHEALHRIGNAMMQQLYQMQREHRGFNRAAYVRALNEL